MIQTSRRSAILPSNAMHPTHDQRGDASATSPSPSRAQPPVIPSAHDSQPSTPSQRHKYPLASPPAHHRSRTSPPVPVPSPTQRDHDSPRSALLSDTNVQKGTCDDGETSTRRLFHSAHRLRSRQGHNSLTLLPTPVRAPCAFSFELAPSSNEFLYVGPQTSETHSHQQLFDPVLRPVPETAFQIPPSDLGIVYTNPEAFDDSVQVPADMRHDPRVQQFLVEGFLYLTKVGSEKTGYAASGDEMKVFEEEGVVEDYELPEFITHAGDDEEIDTSTQLEIPGMWRG